MHLPDITGSIGRVKTVAVHRVLDTAEKEKNQINFLALKACLVN